MCKIQDELDRRNFLKRMIGGSLFLAANPLDMFMGNYLAGFLRTGLAHAAGDTATAFSDSVYINFTMVGGFPRWFFDNPMTPNGTTDPLVANSMVINRFNTSGSGIVGAYATTKVGDYYLPYLWASPIPASGGGITNMSQLANSMLIIRGINLNLDSHDLDRSKQVAPLQGGLSLNGIVADQATTPLPSTGFNGSQAYRSAKGVSYLEMATNDPIKDVMTPFTPPGNSVTNMLSMRSATVETAMDSVLDRMKTLSASKQKYLPSTYQDRLNAKTLMKTSFGDLSQTYQTLVLKYRTLINRSFGDASVKLAGLDDITVPGANNDNRFQFNSGANNAYYTGADLRKTLTMASSIANLAEGMAIAEYMVMNKYSSTVNVALGGWINQPIDSMFNKDTNSTQTNVNFAGGTDAHFTGSFVMMYWFSKYYVAVAACMNELITQLKTVPSAQGNLFNQTAISLTSEFNRAPRTDGSGADHGWNACSYTIFTGKLSAPLVVGNTTSTTNQGVIGSWGLAAPLAEIQGRMADIGNAASTVAAILNITSPTPNDMSFVSVSGNNLVSNLSRTKVVA
jgi:hypothetical protein